MTRVTLRRTTVRAAAAAAVFALALIGCGQVETMTATPDPVVTPSAETPVETETPTPSESPDPTPTESATPTATAETTEPAPTPEDSAAALLATLAVKGRAPMTGYDRNRFGPAWLDADRNGCDTRNDVLAAHLTDLVFDPGTRNCVVHSGQLQDTYTAATIDFVRGHGFLVDVDHVVAMGNAWVTGAFRWDVKKRAAFANDPLNLLPVDASTNRQKGDGDAATWLPPHRPYRCAYVARQVSVKAKYKLWVTPPERDAMARVLETCPEQAPVPDSGAPVRVDHDVTDPGVAPPPAPKVPTQRPEPAPEAVHYQNCDAARAAGAAPVRRGDPGYGSHLDRDGDGVGCE